MKEGISNQCTWCFVQRVQKRTLYKHIFHPFSVNLHVSVLECSLCLDDICLIDGLGCTSEVHIIGLDV